MLRIAAMMAVLATPAVSGGVETCQHAAKIAGNIMQARQNGASVKDVIGPILSVTPEESQPLVSRIVTSAFEYPRYSSPEYRQRAVTDFENTIFLGCMDAF